MHAARAEVFRFMKRPSIQIASDKDGTTTDRPAIVSAARLLSGLWQRRRNPCTSRARHQRQTRTPIAAALTLGFDIPCYMCHFMLRKAHGLSLTRETSTQKLRRIRCDGTFLKPRHTAW